MTSMIRIAIVSLMWASASAAVAQQPAADSNAEYEKIVSEALEEMQAGRFEEARSSFLRAHRLQPNARTLRALGHVEFEMRHYAAAVRYFRQALAAQGRKLTAEMIAEVENGLARAEAYCAQLKPVLSPQNATVTVDGEALALEPDGNLLLDLGTHEVVASAPGHAQTRRSLTTNGGERGELQITLSVEVAPPEGAGSKAHTGSAASADYDEGSTVLQEWWFWTAVGVVAVGTTVAIVVATSGDETEEPLRGNLGETRAVLRWGP